VGGGRETGKNDLWGGEGKKIRSYFLNLVPMGRLDWERRVGGGGI